MHLELLDGESVFVIHGLLSPQECQQLIVRSDALGYESAALGGEVFPQMRNNGRALLQDAQLAAELWRRAQPFVPARLETVEACGLHERFRFYRYEVAERFGPHMDGSVRRGDAEESRLTFMVYLSEVEEGGATNFYGAGGVLQMAAQPSAGKALVFDHRRLHEGAPVQKGRKYVLRTDVMYRPAPVADPT